MILSSKLSFSVFCAIPESFDVANAHEVEIPDGVHDGFQGQVSSDLIAAQFSLNKYTEDWSAVDNESTVEIGASTNFQVDADATFPSELIKYFITECSMDGKNDQGMDMSYVLNHGIDCFSPIIAAGHMTPRDLTFNMFAYGHSEAALESNILRCSIQLCVGDSCYNDYYSAKEVCRQGYIGRSAPAKMLYSRAEVSERRVIPQNTWNFPLILRVFSKNPNQVFFMMFDRKTELESGFDIFSSADMKRARLLAIT